MLRLRSVSEEAMTDLVRTIREKLAKITPWPWKIEQETCNCLDIHSEGKLVCQVIDNDGDEITDQMAADAEMIIRAAPWLSEAADEIERLKIMEGERNDMLDATAKWDQHPEDWDAPCFCKECQVAAQ